MPVALTVTVFLGSLCLSIFSSFIMARGIDGIGARLHLAQGLFGSWLRSRPTRLRYPRLFLHSWIIGAIWARGWCWVLTSSTWQPCWALVPCLQAMSGFGSRLVMNGIAGLSIIGLAGALLLGLLGPVLALLLALLIFIPYAVSVSLQPSQIQRIVPRGPLCDFLCREVTPSSDYEHENGPQSQPRSEMLAVVPALLAIIAAAAAW